MGFGTFCYYTFYRAAHNVINRDLIDDKYLADGGNHVFFFLYRHGQYLQWQVTAKDLIIRSASVCLSTLGEKKWTYITTTGEIG